MKDRKSKSIAGEVINDKFVFKVENDVTGEENKEPVDIKLIRFNS